MTSPRTAVLLLAHGSPDSPAEVPEFMNYITGGRPVPEAAIEEVRRRYSLVGKFPLTEITLAQGEAMQHELGLPVYVGMRNWRPFIADIVRQMAEDGIEQVLAICLAPQNSSTSVGLYKRVLLSQMRPEISLNFVEEWHDHPLLVRAFAEKLEPVWRRASTELGSPAPVVFTAHSVPTRTIQAGDPYEQQAKETAERVANEVKSLAPELQYFAFQSQGMSGGPWLGPTVERMILDLKKQGHHGLVIAPVGFLCDNIEVLYDIDIGFRTFASEQGMKLWRTESLNNSLTLISALTQLATEKLALLTGRDA